MEKNKFEERLNYENLLVKKLDKIGDAMEHGETGTIELNVLCMYIAEPIFAPIKPEIEKINERHEKLEKELIESWKEVDGHPLNNRTKIVMTPIREAEKIQLKSTANQLIVNKIVTALYNSGMLLTRSTNMPSHLVG